MNSAQKAVVSAAKKDGLSPMEIASELMNHDITEVVLGFMRKREVAFNKLSESEQDSVIQELGSELKKITSTACRVINANGVETVGATLKSLKIDGKLTATMVIDGDEPNRHVLTDKAHDKSSILIVLYPNDYSQGMGAHQGEKDQKSLPLGEDAPKIKAPRNSKSKAKEEDKPIEIPEGMLNQAREFVTGQQNATFGGLQNFLMIDIRKADAIFKLLEGEGVVLYEGDEKTGNYVLVRASDSPAEEELAAAPERNFNELCALVKAKVIESGQVSVGALTVAFDASVEDIEQAIDALEMDGVVSEEDDLGGRTVLMAPAE